MALLHRTTPAREPFFFFETVGFKSWGDHIARAGSWIRSIHLILFTQWLLSPMPLWLEAEGTAINKQMKCVPSGDSHS